MLRNLCKIQSKKLLGGRIGAVQSEVDRLTLPANQRKACIIWTAMLHYFDRCSHSAGKLGPRSVGKISRYSTH
jgi:hypothetical protein